MEVTDVTVSVPDAEGALACLKPQFANLEGSEGGLGLDWHGPFGGPEIRWPNGPNGWSSAAVHGGHVGDAEISPTPDWPSCLRGRAFGPTVVLLTAGER